MSLRVEALVVRYGTTTVLHGIDFSVAPGELVALIGPNGAGKTTCFNAINGQVKSATGRVTLDGQTMLGLSPARIWSLGVGRTFQITATVASMTVRENVQMGLIAARGRLTAIWPTARRLYREDADQLLDEVGMLDQASRACGVLSYGDLKRVELAVALTKMPKLLLMDEPTAGMASAERNALMALTSRLARNKAIAVLFTDHDVDIVFAVADRILVLHRGRLIAAGPPAAIRSNEAVRQVYLGGGTTYGAAAKAEAPC